MDNNLLKTLVNKIPRDYKNVKVYVADPWYNNQPGFIKNIAITNKPSKELKPVPGKRCAKKMFDGRPREWRTSSGKNIKWFGGFWTVEQCKTKCVTTPGCQEFRVKKNR